MTQSAINFPRSVDIVKVSIKQHIVDTVPLTDSQSTPTCQYESTLKTLPQCFFHTPNGRSGKKYNLTAMTNAVNGGACKMIRVQNSY